MLAGLFIEKNIALFSWTFDDAVDYLVNNTIMMRDQCEGEIKRYVRWPGQACSYKIGEMQIKKLRDEAISHLGNGSVGNGNVGNVGIAHLGNSPSTDFV